MALRQCGECRGPISSEASTCPRCGAPVKRKRIALVVGLAVVIFVGLSICVCTGVFNLGGNDAKSECGMGGTISVGCISYCVRRAWFSDRLSIDQFFNRRADAKWLFVELVVRNDDSKPRTIPPFMLVDEHGAEYEASVYGAMIEGALDLLESLNPSVVKHGLVIFDVPSGRQYKLKVLGGYWSTQEAFIRLVAEAAPEN